jgi:hypothetical protein
VSAPIPAEKAGSGYLLLTRLAPIFVLAAAFLSGLVLGFWLLHRSEDSRSRQLRSQVREAIQSRNWTEAERWLNAYVNPMPDAAEMRKQIEEGKLSEIARLRDANQKRQTKTDIASDARDPSVVEGRMQVLGVEPATVAHQNKDRKREDAKKLADVKPIAPSSMPAAEGIVTTSELPPGLFWQVLVAMTAVEVRPTWQTLKDKGFVVVLSRGPYFRTHVLVGPYHDLPSFGRAKTDLEAAGFRPVRYKRN